MRLYSFAAGEAASFYTSRPVVRQRGFREPACSPKHRPSDMSTFPHTCTAGKQGSVWLRW